MARKSKPDLDAVDRQMARPTLSDDERQLRDTFAAAALVGLAPKEWPVEQIADTAYRIADAMLAERKR
jgi:hypothetical protein